MGTEEHTDGHASDLGPVVAELDTRLSEEEKHDHPQFARTDEVRVIAREEAERVLTEHAQAEADQAPEVETITVETPPDPEPQTNAEPEPRKPRSRRYGKAR